MAVVDALVKEGERVKEKIKELPLVIVLGIVIFLLMERMLG